MRPVDRSPDFVASAGVGVPGGARRSRESGVAPAMAALRSCSLSEAGQMHRDLVRQYLASVASFRDDFFAALDAAVSSDGASSDLPTGARCCPRWFVLLPAVA